MQCSCSCSCNASGCVPHFLYIPCVEPVKLKQREKGRNALVCDLLALRSTYKFLRMLACLQDQSNEEIQQRVVAIAFSAPAEGLCNVPTYPPTASTSPIHCLDACRSSVSVRCRCTFIRPGTRKDPHIHSSAQALPVSYVLRLLHRKILFQHAQMHVFLFWCSDSVDLLFKLQWILQ